MTLGMMEKDAVESCCAAGGNKEGLGVEVVLVVAFSSSLSSQSLTMVQAGAGGMDVDDEATGVLGGTTRDVRGGVGTRVKT